ncbi:hypothetical protein HII31_03376 [Pseudocercospora fuligena]|uniref:Uncharacterized protein n=1 Tax=Pseudocercospora fuligena TaxID=685502 RepID=A0A8H6VQG8_9PEZI|nr:hypothetical protein HII31_03376 [Pseudocercospora fuligena]
MLMDSDFKDVVTDAFIARIEGKSSADQNIYFPNSDCRVLLYQKTAPNSKLRQLLVHVMRQGEGSSGFLREEDTPTFLLDYAKADGSINALAHAAECGYHEHEKGDENCYRTKYATGSSMKVVNRL